MLKDKKKYLFLIVYIFIIIIIGVNTGLNRIVISDYNPMNGDWQNYNPVRRVIAGYIPFVDFTPYLGVGEIVALLPFLIIKNTFTMSLFATNFLGIIFFILTNFVIIFLATKNKFLASSFSLIIPIIINRFQKFHLFVEIRNQMMIPGNSFRVLRSFLPILITIIFLIIIKMTCKKKFLKTINKKNISILGLFVGFFCIWSNDYGYSVLIASSITVFFVLLYQRKSVFQIAYFFILYILFSVIGLSIATCIVTLGQPLSYFKATLGISEDQYWYYSFVKISNVRVLLKGQFPLIFPVPVCYVYFFYRFLKHKMELFDFISFFILSTSFFASLIYTFGSGNYMNTNLLFISIIFIIGWLFKFLIEFIKKRNFSINHFISENIFNTILILLLVFNLSKTPEIINNRTFSNRGVFVKELGGYTSYGDSLESAKKLVGTNQIFSTYAGALENITDQFQPSGTDYIIHALGSSQREKYLDNFINGNYKFSQTIRPDFSHWEIWVENANWFFYKELYSNYKPKLLTDYSLIWEKSSSEKINEASTINVTNINPSQVTISVKLSSEINCIADLKLNYATSFSPKDLDYRMVLLAESEEDIYSSFTSMHWGLPTGKNESYNLPLKIKDGYGEISLNTYPINFSTIKINDALIEQLVPNPDFSQFFQGTTENLTDENWENGVSRNENILLFKNDISNYFLFENKITKIKIDNQEYEIESVENNEKWIKVQLPNEINKDLFKYPKKISFR